MEIKGGKPQYPQRLPTAADRVGTPHRGGGGGTKNRPLPLGGWGPGPSAADYANSRQLDSRVRCTAPCFQLGCREMGKEHYHLHVVLLTEAL